MKTFVTTSSRVFWSKRTQSRIMINYIVKMKSNLDKKITTGGNICIWYTGKHTRWLLSIGGVIRAFTTAIRGGIGASQHSVVMVIVVVGSSGGGGIIIIIALFLLFVLINGGGCCCDDMFDYIIILFSFFFLLISLIFNLFIGWY